MDYAQHNSVKTLLIFSVILLLMFSNTANADTDNTSQPKQINPDDHISIWYGDIQKFGAPGLAQRWVNIPGQIIDPYHSETLFFSLNKGPMIPLQIGPDSRRLSSQGDFNIEIDAEHLRTGNNDLHITRILEDNNRTGRYVKLNYQAHSWPLPYRIDWEQVNNIQDAVQVIDGLWLLKDNGIRTAPNHIGYDRTVAIGDDAWTSYEVTFSFTVNDIDPAAYKSPESVSPNLGLILHWNGHTNTPVDCGQLHCGWFPFGAILWYTFPNTGEGGFNINTRPINDLSISLPFNLKIGSRYIMRSRVETLPFRTLYFLKVWPEEEKEPTKWSFQKAADRKNPGQGGILFVAHHVDLTIGNISVMPIDTKKATSFKEYIILLPLILTLTAGVLFLFFFKTAEDINRRKKTYITVLCLAGIALCFYCEPLLPSILETYPFSSKMSAILYIGFDIGYALFHVLVWAILLITVFHYFKWEARR